MYRAYTFVILAAAANLGCIYFMKLSRGVNLSWATLEMIICSFLLLWFLRAAFAGGINVGIAVTILNVTVMLGALCLGLIFGERVSLYQGIGIAIAIVGVVVANVDAMRAT